MVMAELSWHFQGTTQPRAPEFCPQGGHCPACGAACCPHTPAIAPDQYWGREEAANELLGKSQKLLQERA